MSKIDTLPRPDDISPEIAAFLREIMPPEPVRRTVAARVLFDSKGTPISQPIAQPGEF